MHLRRDVFRLLSAPWSWSVLTPTPLSSEPERGPGDHTHDAPAFEIEEYVDRLAGEDIELSNGVTSGGQGAKREHEDLSTENTAGQITP
jgi:hypothetical protein